MDVTQRTYDKIAKDYFRLWNTYHVTSAYRNKFIRLVGKGKILDLGCGPGIDSKFFSRNFGVIGIDASGEMIKLAKKVSPRARFLRRDMRRIELRPLAFGGIWASQSLHHIPKRDCRILLRRLRAMLKQGGILFVCVKQGSADGYTEEGVTETFRGKRRYVATYRPAELKQEIRIAGFKILSFHKRTRLGGKETYISVFARK